MSQSGTRDYNGNVARHAGPLGHLFTSGANSTNADLGAYSSAQGNGNKAAKLTPCAAVTASGLVVKRQWDDANETITAWPAGVPLPFQVSVIVSSTVDTIASW